MKESRTRRERGEERRERERETDLKIFCHESNTLTNIAQCKCCHFFVTFRVGISVTREAVRRRMKCEAQRKKGEGRRERGRTERRCVQEEEDDNILEITSCFHFLKAFQIRQRMSANCPHNIRRPGFCRTATNN